MDSANPAWLRVVNDYVKACHEDFLWLQSCRLKGPKLVFLANHGCDLVYQRHAAAIHRTNSTLSNQEESIQWEILSEQEDRVLVEMECESLPPIHRQAPFEDIRVLLKHLDGHWRISRIYRRCISCNLNRRRSNPGVCPFCKGGDLDSLLGKCKECNGTRQCQSCCDSDYVGWIATDR